MDIPKDLVAASATPLVLTILADSDSYGYAIIKRVTGHEVAKRPPVKPEPPKPTAPATVTARADEDAAPAPGGLIPVPV